MLGNIPFRKHVVLLCNPTILEIWGTLWYTSILKSWFDVSLKEDFVIC